MVTFSIGQYGKFDETKYKRDFLDGFHGIEACSFESEADTAKLIRESRGRGFRVGIHFPLRAGRAPLRDALFLSQQSDTRKEAMRLIEDELSYLDTVQPDYVLFHYPKPVILDDRVDWGKWRFADRSEYVYESQYPLQEFEERSEQLFQWLSRQSEIHKFTPVLEFDALNRYVVDTDIVERLLERYPRIRLCLDTGRLHIQEKLDPSFNAIHVIRKFAKYTHMVHLWNVQVRETIEHNHYPVLPEYNPSEGWAPIETYLKLLLEANPEFHIVFEHRSELVSDETLLRCYHWIGQITTEFGRVSAMRTEAEVLRQLLDYAEEDEGVRAVLLNGSRVNPNVQRDLFNDYDVIFAVDDPEHYWNDQAWIRRFGKPIIMQHNAMSHQDRTWYIMMMIFEDGVRIDLSFRKAEDIESYVQDSLTKVLLDKDSRIPDLPPPSDSSYITRMPERQQYDAAINEIWWCSTYVAKGLLRKELPYAKFMLDSVVREALVQLLAWYVGSQNEWLVNTGKAGRWLSRFLPAELWDSYVKTYAGAEEADNWAALEEIGKLTRIVGMSLAEQLGYVYPIEDDRKVSNYLKDLRKP